MVCHSGSRGVVHYGSSSHETGYDESVIRMRTERRLELESIQRNHGQLGELSSDEASHKETALQNNLVSRPRVIVAKETCL